MVTIRDVAKRAGVSVTTVSRVINNSPKVSKETRKKVLHAMEELGFSPRPWAKYLALPKSKVVSGVVITPRIKKFMSKGAFYYEVFRGIKSVAKVSGVEVKVMYKEDVEDAEGYLLIGADFDRDYIEELRKRGKPKVLVDHYIPGMKIDAVVSDGYGGAYNAVELLIKTGHRRIVHIHSPLTAYSFRERFNGYINAMEKHGLMAKVYEFDDVAENMGYVVDLMLNTYGMPDAIFTSNDFAAIRLLKELRKRGIRVPDDVSIVGFDDSPEAEKFGFASVRVFKEELGSFAMRRLITLMMGQDLHPAKISLFTELVIRGSVKTRKGG